MRAQLAAAYLLHRRPFRDSSEVLEVFSLDYGRVALVARGMGRRRRGGSLASLLQPFRPLLLSFSGRGDLMTLGAAEIAGEDNRLEAEALFSGFYLNELLLRLLQRFEANPELFAVYSQTIADLGQGLSLEPVLRRFEFALLDVLGYAVDLEYEAVGGRRIEAAVAYRLDTERGFIPMSCGRDGAETSYPGRDLLALARAEYADCPAVAKRLARVLLKPHLGAAPLSSRSMFATAVASRPSGAHQQ